MTHEVFNQNTVLRDVTINTIFTYKIDQYSDKNSKSLR